MNAVGVHRRGSIQRAPVPIHSTVETSCAAVMQASHRRGATSRRMMSSRPTCGRLAPY